LNGGSRFPDVDGCDLRPAQKIARRKRYPLVLMLEPLFRCNLACAGCGKIQYPAHILKRDLSPEECFKAVDECGAPMVSIPGGEPLMHPEIDKIVEGLVARKKIYLSLHQRAPAQGKASSFQAQQVLSFSVHMDGKESITIFLCVVKVDSTSPLRESAQPSMPGSE